MIYKSSSLLFALCVGGTSAADAGNFHNPEGLAIAPQTLHLWVANSGSNTVVELVPGPSGLNNPGPFSIGTVISNGLSGPSRIAFDNKGNLYVANGGVGNSVTIYLRNSAGTYSLSPNLTLTDQIHRPLGIAISSDNDLYIVNNENNKLLAYENFNPSSGTAPNPTQVISISSAPGALALAGGSVLIAFGPSSGSSSLQSYSTIRASPPLQLQPPSPFYTLPNPAQTGPTGIAVDPYAPGSYAVSFLYSGNVYWLPRVPLGLTPGDVIGQAHWILRRRSHRSKWLSLRGEFRSEYYHGLPRIYWRTATN